MAVMAAAKMKERKQLAREGLVPDSRPGGTPAVITAVNKQN